MGFSEDAIRRRLKMGYLTRKQVAAATGLTEELIASLESGKGEFEPGTWDRYTKVMHQHAPGRNWYQFWQDRFASLSQQEYYLLCHGTLNERLIWAMQQLLTAVDRPTAAEVFGCSEVELDLMLAGKRDVPIEIADRLDAVGVSPHWMVFGHGIEALESAQQVWRMPGAGPYLVAIRKAMEAGVPADVLVNQVGLLASLLKPSKR